MATTFLSLSSALFASTDEAEKWELTEKLSDLLSQNYGLTETLIAPLVVGLMSSIPSLDSYRRGEFYHLHHRAYRDIDGQVRVAIGVAFLQDFTQHDPDMDRKVLDELYVALQSQNLDLLINDLTVNATQVRDGQFASLL